MPVRAAIRRSVSMLFMSVAWAGVAQGSAPHAAAPAAVSSKAHGTNARAKYKTAAQLVDKGAHDEALAVIEEGLASAPKDLLLLRLKGSVLMTLHNLPGALAAYQAYLAAGVTGAKKRQVEELVKELLPVLTTFLDVTVTEGPAQIYLPAISKALFCTAWPSCARMPMLPRAYQVVAERAGFERWSGRVTVTTGKITLLAITLVELRSMLVVRTTPPGAGITVDGAPFDPTVEVAAGAHRIVVSLAGHANARREVTAHEGKPVELDVTLMPVVPIRVVPPGAVLALDDKPIEIEDGRIVVQPGDHTLVARARGFRDGVTRIPADRAASYEIVVDLAPAVVAATAPRPPVQSRFTARRKLALAMGGVAVAGVAAGIALGLQANQLDRDAYAICPSPTIGCAGAATANDRNQRARTRALDDNVVFGAAGAAALLTGILWLTGAPESRVAITPRLGEIAGLDLATTF